jgi:all-trans-retinol dehydrogenase (NAD+)
MKLMGATAVVTGAATGIGLATCRRLAAAGCTLTLWDIDAKGLAKAKRELGGSGAAVYAVRCDVSRGREVAACAKRAIRDMGRVDILINNAGILVPGTFLEQPVERWEATVSVNLVSILHPIRAFLPAMHKRGTGHVVNISSAAGTLGVPGIAVYSATKWAVWGLTESLRHESWNAGKRGVRWSSIHPNYVREGLFAGARLPGLSSIFFPRVRSHDEVAKAIVEYALKRGRFAPKRPRMVKTTLVLRGLLNDGLFFRAVRLFGVHRSMDAWVGKKRNAS